jgi:hypothetical protein
MELALRPYHEPLAQKHEHAGRPFDAAPTRLRDRTAASQRSVRAGGAALLLRPMQIQLPGLREQGRGPQRRSSSDNRRRKSPAVQYLRRRPVPGARSIRIGGDGSCRGPTSAIAQQTRSARQCGSCGPNPDICLGGPAAAFAPPAHPDARKFRQVAGRSARPDLEHWPRERGPIAPGARARCAAARRKSGSALRAADPVPRSGKLRRRPTARTRAKRRPRLGWRARTDQSQRR